MVYKLIGVYIISILFVVVANQSAFAKGDSAITPASVGQQIVGATTGRIISLAAEGITKTAYLKIKEGMTLAEVEAIIGSKGEEVAKNRSGEVYAWYRKNGTYIMCFFSDGRLTDKSNSLLD